jgi:hypothetical protein
MTTESAESRFVGMSCLGVAVVQSTLDSELVPGPAQAPSEDSPSLPAWFLLLALFSLLALLPVDQESHAMVMCVVPTARWGLESGITLLRRCSSS